MAFKKENPLVPLRHLAMEDLPKALTQGDIRKATVMGYCKQCQVNHSEFIGRELVFVSHCHPESGVDLVYLNGELHVLCCECRTWIVRFLLATGEPVH